MTIFNLLIAVLLNLLPWSPGGGDAGGDAGGDPQPDPKPDAAGGAGGAPDGSGSNPDTGGGSTASGGDKGDQPDNPAAARASAEAARYRTQLKEERDRSSRLLSALKPALDVLGIKVEGAEVDPAELAKQADTWKGKYMAERVSNAVHRQAATLGARPEALMRYLRGGDELSGLDPEADEFEQELKAIAQRALEAEPGLKAAPAVPQRSGAEFSGQGGKTLDEQIAEAEKAGDYKTSMRLKLAKQDLERQSAGGTTTS